VADRVRFHLDEHVDPAIAHALRRHGVDVTTTLEAGLRTRGDEAHWEFARSSQRVIVTHDPDFLRLSRLNADHWGIAYCHRTARSIGEMIRSLILIHEVLTPEDLKGRVEYL
jgi:predicted nuclease of predicted toxin-antitoxin system